MEIHEIIRENGKVTKDEYVDISPEAVIVKIVGIVASGRPVALRSNTLHDEVVSILKGKGKDEYFSLIFDNEKETQKNLMTALKAINKIEYF